MSIYSTRTMLQAINQAKPAYSFLKDTFFPNVKTVPTEKVEVDYKKGKRQMAPYVSPRIGGKTLTRQGFTTKTYKVPKVAPERLLTIDDISTRSAGENIYSTKSPDERAADLLVTDLDELEQSIIRREEWACREVLLDGKLVMKGEGVEEEIDYNFTNKVTLSGTDMWSDSANCKPINDLKENRRSIIKKTGKAPNVTIMSSDAADLFLESAQVKEYFDKKHILLGNIEPTIKNPAVTFIGKVNSLGLEVYSYDEWFIDDEEEEQPIIPEGTVLIASTGMNKMLYGAVTQVEKGVFTTYEASRVPKVWADEENEVQKVRLSSRPLPVPEDVDSWCVLKVK